MTPNDIVYKTVYTRCLAAGCTEMVSKDAAIMALQKFKNNQFIKATKLIDQAVVEAKKLIVKKRR